MNLLLVACGATTSKGDGDVIEMNFSSYNPSTHHFAYNVLEPWKEIVEEKTDGRVKVNLFHGGTLGGSKTVLEDISGGLADAGIAITPYFIDSKLFPYTIGNLPFAFQDAETGAKVITKFADKYAKGAIEEVHYMGGAFTSDAYDLFSTNPVHKLEDVKNMTIKVSGKSDAEIIKAWGAVPVSIEYSGVYEALQKGTLDAAPNSSIGSNDFKHYEVAPYITKLGLMVTPALVIMNKDFYNSLPDDLKELFDNDLSPKLTELFTETYVKGVEEAYENFEEVSKEVITLSPEEMKEFILPAEKVWDDWVQTANDKGYPGNEMMSDFKEMLAEEGVELPF